MAYSATRRQAGSDQRLPVVAQFAAVFDFPGFVDAARELRVPDHRGEYPAGLLLGLVIATRAAGSQRHMVANLRAEGVWEMVTDLYARHVGHDGPLPVLPPTERQMDAFIGAILQSRGLLAALRAQFTDLAIAQAKAMGQFPAGVSPDWSDPDPRCMVFGDGTFLKPYSEAVVIDGVLMKSRATTGAPRVQARHTHAGEDKKVSWGVNHVLIGTGTEWGWVVLAVDQALESENQRAEVMVNDLASRIGDGLHTVIWDRIFGAPVRERLLAEHCVLVVSKGVARANGKGFGPTGYTALEMLASEAIDRHHAGDPLPLGISVFPKGSALEKVRTAYFNLEPLQTDTCTHELWTDDGSLVEVTNTAGHKWKTGKATAIRAVPAQDARGEWGLVVTWQLLCPRGPHTVITHWQPRATPPARDTRKGAARAVPDLKPLTRHDAERFTDVYGTRNNAESLNSWVKASMGRSGRAMRLDTDAQLLEVLAAGYLANALVWARFEG